MTIRTVTGTSIQAAIDASVAGDTINVKAGFYAGGLSLKKGIAVRGDGGVIIDGGTFGFDVTSHDTLIEGMVIHHVGAGIRYKGDCANSTARHNVIEVIDHMVVDGTAGANGGNAFQCPNTVGPVTIQHNLINRTRAFSTTYGRDGGAFDLFAGVRGGLFITDNEIIDGVNIMETGKNLADPDPADVTFERNHVRGRWFTDPAPIQATVSNGFFLRSIKNLSIRHNVFEFIDWWLLNLQIGGNFGGSMSGIAFTDNTVRLGPGVNRLVSLTTGTPVACVSEMDRNQVYLNGTTVVAEIAGKGKTIDRATLTGWTGWEPNSYWGAEQVTTVDCSAVTAERDAALAQLAASQAEVKRVTDLAVSARTTLEAV